MWDNFEISLVVFMPNIYHVQIMLLFYTSTRKAFVIFPCRYFKLSWNTTALSQSNCRNFSGSSISLRKLRRKIELTKRSLKGVKIFRCDKLEQNRENAFSCETSLFCLKVKTTFLSWSKKTCMRRSTELLLIRDRNVSVPSLNVIQTLQFLF